MSRKKKAYSIDISIELNCLNYRPSKLTINNEAARKRKLKPYADDINIDIKKRRCREVFKVASFIVGGSKEDKAPILECFFIYHQISSKFVGWIKNIIGAISELRWS